MVGFFLPQLAVMQADSLGFAQHLPDKGFEGRVRSPPIAVMAQESQPVGPGDALKISRIVEGREVLYLPPGRYPVSSLCAVKIRDIDGAG